MEDLDTKLKGYKMPETLDKKMINNFTKLFLVTSKLRYINRFATLPTIKSQNVMEHSGGVAMLGAMFLSIYDGLLPERTCSELLIRLILHDFNEVGFGDLIWPIRKFKQEHLTTLIKDRLDKVIGFLSQTSGGHDCYNALLDNGISEEVNLLVEYFDRLEGLIYVREEERLGNRNLRDIMLNFVNLLFEVVEKLRPLIDKKVCAFLEAMVVNIYYFSWQSNVLNLQENVK